MFDIFILALGNIPTTLSKARRQQLQRRFFLIQLENVVPHISQLIFSIDNDCYSEHGRAKLGKKCQSLACSHHLGHVLRLESVFGYLVMVAS